MNLFRNQLAIVLTVFQVQNPTTDHRPPWFDSNEFQQDQSRQYLNWADETTNSMPRKYLPAPPPTITTEKVGILFNFVGFCFKIRGTEPCKS